ncbi:MAG TPA: hypothetical protein VLY04_17350, partial [Bryobacteraceae bacterium]|nr:hypothetical protein [Bryobacteraceae bacterium]
MARTNVERVDKSIAYIRDNVSRTLAGKFAGIDKEAAGAQISLSKAGFMFTGTKDQHWALRALLLCQWKFLGNDAKPAQAKAFFKPKAQTDIHPYILAYTTDSPSHEKLASKAEAYTL